MKKIITFNLILAMILFIAVPMVSWGYVTLTKTWTTGEILTSADLNANFTDLNDALDDVVTDISDSITSSFIQDNSQYIATDEIRARDSGGLKLYEDGGTKGIFIADDGNTHMADTLFVSKEHTIIGADSSLFLLVTSSGVPVIGLKGSDGDGTYISINTSDQMVFSEGGGGYLFDFPIHMGVEDATTGWIYLYGDDGTTDPAINMYNSGDNDGTENAWTLQPNGADFYLGPTSDADEFIFGNTGDLTIGGDLTIPDTLFVSREQTVIGADSSLYATVASGQPVLGFRASDGDAVDISITTGDILTITGAASVGFGTADTEGGILRIYGDNAEANGLIYLFNSANNDETEDYWRLTASGDGNAMWLGPVSDVDEFIFTNDGNLTMGGDLTITGGNITTDVTFDGTVTLTDIFEMPLNAAFPDTTDYDGGELWLSAIGDSLYSYKSDHTIGALVFQ